jgi:uncharacterized protein YjlB
MKIFRQKKWKGGWFCGSFKKTAFHSNDFEVCFKKHKKGEIWPKHYHKIATEVNYLIKGKMIIQNQTLNSGDVFILKPLDIADPIFLKDCELIVIKTPSIKNDKYEV